jgi:hypothetical protein
MLFMVIEHFRDNDAAPAYRRLRDFGRQLPPGLEYLESWVAADLSRCFQLMRCADASLFQRWIVEWRDVGVTFEVIPVVVSKETRETLTPFLGKPSRDS